MRTANSLVMKEINQHLVRRQLLSQQAATKQQLAKQTGLSAMTVGSIIADLEKNGEVIEGKLIPSNGGRPSAEYHYNGGYGHTAVVYGYQKQNRNFITLVVLDLLGQCVYTDEQYLDIVNREHFDRMLDRAFASVPGIRVICLGLPGEEQEGIITINDYPELIGEPLIQCYRRKYNANVLIINDVNAAALGYYIRNAKPQPSKTAVVGLYFPRLYAPGMGLILDGQIYSGKQNFVGELGHLPLDIIWDQLDYADKPAVYDALSRLLTIIICITAPDSVVMYGDFFEVGDADRIKAQTEKVLRGDFTVALEVTDGFEVDYAGGLSAIALETLYTSLFGEGEGK